MHAWKFYRAGGIDQVLIRDGADIEHLAELDQKLWMALCCPVKGVRFDARTFELLDAEKDGRIRVPELLSAIKWLKARLVSLDGLLEGSETMRLSAICPSSPEGARALASARRILVSLGKGEADAISLSDVADTAKIFADTRFNGDGVVCAEAAEDAETRAVIEEIIAAYGPETDRSGKAGLNQAKADAFFAAVAARLAWSDRADAAVLPLGDRTAAAAAALAAVRPRVEDYFTRCRMSAFDGRAAGPLSRADSDFAALASLELSDALPALAGFPLSKIEAGRDLPLSEGLNPYWAGAVASFREAAVIPVFGQDCVSLSSDQWNRLKALLAPYETWCAENAGAAVAALGVDRLKALASSGARDAVDALIAKDVAQEEAFAQIAEVEKLLRLNANLVALLNNFVNMAHFYDVKACALFRVGTLYVDARACSLCFDVENLAAHAAQAAASKCCLVYCALSRPATKEARTICAAVTAGYASTLWVGRNGIFYDMDGKDWDASIVKVVDNAISLKEAFWDPWRKIAGLVGSQIRKLLAARQDNVLSGASKKVEAAGTAPAEAPKKMEGAALASSVAALGIAVGLVGSAVGGLVGMIAGLPLWKTLVGLVAVVLLVSGPAVILTWLKLRERDIAPILNACGWAVNRNLRLSRTLGRLFTTEAVLPAHSERQITDPYADRHPTRDRLVAFFLVVAVALVLWLLGLLDSVLPEVLKRNLCDRKSHAAVESAVSTFGK